MTPEQGQARTPSKERNSNTVPEPREPQHQPARRCSAGRPAHVRCWNTHQQKEQVPERGRQQTRRTAPLSEMRKPELSPARMTPALGPKGSSRNKAGKAGRPPRQDSGSAGVGHRGCGCDTTARCERAWGRGWRRAGPGLKAALLRAQFLDFFIPSSNKRELHDSLDVFSSKPFIFFLESSRPRLLPGILQKQLLPVWALKNEMHMGCSIAQAECNVLRDLRRGRSCLKSGLFTGAMGTPLLALWAQENEATASWPLSPRPPV